MSWSKSETLGNNTERTVLTLLELLLTPQQPASIFLPYFAEVGKKPNRLLKS